MEGCVDAPLTRGSTVAEVARLLGDIAALKRIRWAGNDRSAAESIFLDAWARLRAGQSAQSVAERACADALVGARLGALIAQQRETLGIPQSIAHAALAEAGEHWADRLGPALDDTQPAGPAPAFAHALCSQPRAGATRPGHRRLVLWPPESHGDHCLLVGVGAALLAWDSRGDAGTAFLAGLAHHLHNARLPDIGFEGEVLLGEALDPLVARLRAEALATLPAALAAAIERALGQTRDTTTAEGRALHAADVIDRVQEVHYHAALAAFRAEHALVDMELVHPGPLQTYQNDVLRQAGLA